MVEPSLLLTFTLTSLLLIVIPGPNIAFIVANSLGQGTRAGLLTVAGTASAGALMSLTNPKALVFYAAFLLQFIDPARRVGPQLAELGAVWFVIGAVNDVTWALFAGRLRPFLATRGRLRNRVSRGLMVGAGAELALSRRT